MPAGLQAMMIFLAGMGLPVFESAMNKLRGGGAKGKTALGKEAAGNPQMTNSATAQMIARLAAMRQQGGAPGAAPAMPPAAAQLGGLIGR